MTNKEGKYVILDNVGKMFSVFFFIVVFEVLNIIGLFHI